MNRIVVVGLGGIGSWVLQGLCPFLNYQQEAYTLILVDGDEYEPKNHTRQVFTELGPKADVQAKWIIENFPKLGIKSVPEFVSANGAKETLPIARVIESGDTVFSCVDNHKTRRVLAKYCEKLDDIVLISGGNEYSDGNSQVFIRKDKENLTATLTKYHPEMEDPKDKAPFELSCEEAAVSSPQLIFANMTAASLMLNIYYSIREGKFDPKFSEFYFDILRNIISGRVRKK
jgi:molybdopterin/thiamine biosynthesis adenylyltransferase